jgi:hypothetical protein
MKRLEGIYSRVFIELTILIVYGEINIILIIIYCICIRIITILLVFTAHDASITVIMKKYDDDDDLPDS